MAWSRMQFRGEPVWVRVDEHGRPVIDSEGRAEMKYRQDDPRSYRPARGNLAAIPDGAAVEAEPARMAKARTKAAPRPAPPPREVGEKVLNVWTDGACSGNPGPMGIGVVVIADGQRQERGEFLGIGTNNIAELVAIERGLEMAEKLDPEHRRPVRVHTDSGYSIGVLTKGWKAKANVELIQRMRRRLAGHPDVTLVKVAGHAGVPENERCDELAREAILRKGNA